MEEKTVTMMEGVAREWRVRVKDSAGNVLNPEGFSFYGAAADGVQVPRRMQVHVEGDVAVLRLPGLWMSGRCWRYQVMCQDVLTGVEWVLCQGDVVMERRVACNGPALHEDAVMVDVVLDSELYQVDVFLGDSTAASAEAARRAEASREAAEAEAARAWDAAAKAEDLKRVALDAAAGAALSAEGAEDSKRGAEAAAVDAAADAQLAEGAAAEAEVSREAAEAAQRQAEVKAAESEASAKVAAEAVSEALAARDEAVAAQRGAADAQVVAEDASAQAGRYAEQAVGASDGAVVAQGKAEAAQSKAEQEAAKAEQKAALLGDAALKGGDNAFTGNNSHSGTEVYNGAVALNDTVTLAGDIYAGSNPLPAGSAGLLRLAVEAFLDGITDLRQSGNSWKSFASFGITKFPDDTVTLRNAVQCLYPSIFDAFKGKKLTIKLPKATGFDGLFRTSGSQIEVLRVEAPMATGAVYAFYQCNKIKSVEVIAEKLTRFAAYEGDGADWLAFIPRTVTRCRVVMPVYKGGAANFRLFSWDAKLDALSVRQMFEPITDEDGTEWPAGFTNWDDGAEHHILISMSKAAAADAEVMRLFGTSEPIQSVSSAGATEPAYQVNGWIVRVRVL